MSDLQKLSDLAELRKEIIQVGGHTIIVNEPSALDYIDYRDLLGDKKNGGRPEALAALIALSCHNEDGTKTFTLEEAKKIILGSGRVALPILKAVTNWLGDEAPKPGKEEAQDASLPSS